MNISSASSKNPVAIFGGSGATGRALISHLSCEGVLVRALARKADSINTGVDRIEVVEWALSKLDDVLATLQGCGAAICVFGPRPPYVDVFCEQATLTIVTAMQQLGIRRLVCQTGGMIGDYRANRTLPFQWMADAFLRHSPRIASDRAGQESVVMHSGLDWMIVKPPRLTDGAAKGTWKAGPHVRLGMLSSVSRDDLSAFLIEEILRPRHIGEVVFVRN